jgi:hypothetical protein
VLGTGAWESRRVELITDPQLWIALFTLATL